ncbi:glycosyltransferase family 2 protein [candidate division KSB1 bacterium]
MASKKKKNATKVDTAVTIVNWNGKHWLKDCLNSLEKQSYGKLMIILIDNDSSDGSVEFVEKNFPSVKVIKLKKNYGFSKGNNAGVEEAFKSNDIKYIFVLNNDTIVHKDCLKNLIKEAESGKKLGSCATKILYLKKKDTINTDGIIIYQDGHAQSLHAFEKASKHNKKMEVFGPTAVAALYKREALEKAGLYDNMFFMYQEEVDLAWRLRYAGYSSVLVPNAIVYHAHSASSERFSPFKAYHTERNRIWLVFKNFTCLMIIKSFYYTIKRYMALIKGLKTKKGSAAEFAKKRSKLDIALILLKAYAVGIALLPLFIPKRIKTQYLRIKNKVGRKEINKWFKKFSTDAERLALLK